MTGFLNPFRTAVPFWGQTSRISSSLSPKRDCGSKGNRRDANVVAKTDGFCILGPWDCSSGCNLIVCYCMPLVVRFLVTRGMELSHRKFRVNLFIVERLLNLSPSKRRVDAAPQRKKERRLQWSCGHIAKNYEKKKIARHHQETQDQVENRKKNQEGAGPRMCILVVLLRQTNLDAAHGALHPFRTTVVLRGTMGNRTEYYCW